MLLLWFESHPDHYLDLFHGSLEFKSSAMLVNSQLIYMSIYIFKFEFFLGLQIFFNQTSLIFISIIEVDYHNLESETKENENQNNLNILKPNKH